MGAAQGARENGTVKRREVYCGVEVDLPDFPRKWNVEAWLSLDFRIDWSRIKVLLEAAEETRNLEMIITPGNIDNFYNSLHGKLEETRGTMDKFTEHLLQGSSAATIAAFVRGLSDEEIANAWCVFLGVNVSFHEVKMPGPAPADTSKAVTQDEISAAQDEIVALLQVGGAAETGSTIHKHLERKKHPKGAISKALAGLLKAGALVESGARKGKRYTLTPVMAQVLP